MSRRRTKPKRRYSDDERAAALAALAANGGNLGQTARQLGIPRQTLQRWQEGSAHPEAAASAAPKKAALADILEAHAHELLERAMDPERVQRAGTPQLMTAFGIAVDKMQLLRGQPTAITDQTHHHDDMTDEDLDARIAELEARLSRPPGGAGTASGAA